MSRVAHNPCDVIHVAMTADALRVIRDALVREAATMRDAAARTPHLPKLLRQVYETRARLAGGVADDLTVAFNGDETFVVGTSMTRDRAAVVAADKAMIDAPKEVR